MEPSSSTAAAPSTGPADAGDSSAPPVSKRQQKREAKRESTQEYWAAKKQHKRDAKKEARRAEAEAKQAEWDALTEEEQQERREATARERAEPLPGPVSSLMLETGWLAGGFLAEIRNWLAACRRQFLRQRT